MRRSTSATAVYLLAPHEIPRSSGPLAAACFEELRAGFALQATTAHTLAPTPDAADVILAPIQGSGYGRSFEALRSSRVYREHGAKIVAYSLDDEQFPAVRGLYPAVAERWVREGWALPAHYISAHIHKFRFTPQETRHKDILFSFVGSSQTHPIREKITRWRHPKGVVVDAAPAVGQKYWWEAADKERFQEMFREIVRRSRFVVCPRGISPSSIRLFEAMEAGAVPIIVADDLQLPLGPAWESFSVRILENDVDEIPDVVELLQARAAEMGKAARAAWETFFSPQATVGSVVGWAERLLGNSHRRSVRLRFEEFTNPQLVKAKLRFAVARR